MSSLPEARPHSAGGLPGGPAPPPLLTCLHFPKKTDYPKEDPPPPPSTPTILSNACLIVYLWQKCVPSRTSPALWAPSASKTLYATTTPT